MNDNINQANEMNIEEANQVVDFLRGEVINVVIEVRIYLNIV